MTGVESKKMTGDVQGIHHVTAVAGDPQKNIDFYLKLWDSG